MGKTTRRKKGKKARSKGRKGGRAKKGGLLFHEHVKTSRKKYSTIYSNHVMIIFFDEKIQHGRIF
jgi:hypothetical protein